MDVFGNGRGVGITDALHAAAEWPSIVLFGVITQLGDGWFLFLLGGTLYVAGDELPRWGIERRRGLFVFGLVLTYVGLIGVLKNTFQLPRPPGAAEPVALQWLPAAFAVIVDSITTADGPGFPSGHALGSTMVWGGLALVLHRGSFRTRIGVATALVVLISVSRLVLGVHYAIDVVIGVGLGVIVLGILYWFADTGSDPGRLFLVAVAIGLLGLMVGITFDSVAAIGGAVGGWIVWRAVAETTPAHPTNRREVLAGFLVLALVAGLFSVLSAVKPPLPVTFFGTAVAVGGVVGAPLLGERLA